MTDQLTIGGATRGGTSRTVLLSASGGLLVAAAVLAVVLFGGDGESDPVPVVATQGAAADDNDAVLEDRGDDLVALPLVTYDVYLDRDPFEPVLQEAEAVQDPEAPPAEDPSPPPPTGGTIVIDPDTGQLIVVPADPPPSTPGTPPRPGDPTQPGTPTDPDPQEPRRCRGDDELVCEGRVVSLTGVEQTAQGPRASFQVDTTTYQVLEGQDFAISFRLLSVDGACATFLYGDERNTLCTGQSALK